MQGKIAAHVPRDTLIQKREDFESHVFSLKMPEPNLNLTISADWMYHRDETPRPSLLMPTTATDSFPATHKFAREPARIRFAFSQSHSYKLISDSCFVLCFLGVEVTMMENAYTFKLAMFVQIVEHILVHDNNVALFPLCAWGACRRSSQNVELGDELHAELPASRKESTYIQDFTYVGGNGLIVGYELLWAVKRTAGQAGYLRTHEVIGICQGDIRAEVTGDFVKPAVVEMIDIFQELLAVHSELPPLGSPRPGGKLPSLTLEKSR